MPPAIPATALPRPSPAPAQPSPTQPDRPGRGPLAGRCAVVLHAHPDDEAIFTAATVHRLTAAGARVVLVTATAGELGPVLRTLRAGETLAARRRAELERACVTAYEATVDRGRSRSRAAHLVDRAAGGGPVGWETAGIATVVEATPAELVAKRAAMAAHGSQVPRSAVRRAGFAAAYGREWYRRVGAPGVLDEVAVPARGASVAR